MQDLSFDFGDKIFEFNGLSFGIQLFTFENVYGLDQSQLLVTQDGSGFKVKCLGLTWAGGQERVEGYVELEAVAGPHSTTFKIEAGCPKTIRCVKLFLTNITPGVIANLREGPAREIPATGLNLRYPDGWRGLYTPLVVLEDYNKNLQYFRSLDDRIREKRFVILPKEDNFTVELLFEDCATEMTNRVKVPAWEVGRAASVEEILKSQAGFIEKTFNLVPWENRPDVPEWAKGISLVAAIHCQHYTGYVFNDYAKVLRTLEWLAERIEPHRILAYLPGWEGRYYWQYGDYRPDPRMGGPAEFGRLVKRAKALGIHVMPMFGINVVNRNLENFEQWGAPAISSHAGGLPQAGSVDWDSSRHYDLGWGALLNPGAPTWQNRLVTQITGLVEEYDFDSVFLDISACFNNDPRYDMFVGTLKLVERLRENNPNLLVAGEGWYDGVGLATPLMQTGHTEGDLHWHDALAYPGFFDKYNRSFAHLCLGDPGRGSTGVHELGYNPITTSPLRKGVIPTVTIVEDTLQKAPAQVEKIIEAAKAYAEMFLASL